MDYLDAYSEKCRGEEEMMDDLFTGFRPRGLEKQHNAVKLKSLKSKLEIRSSTQVPKPIVKFKSLDPTF